jgi:peptide/nickel transport system permease protein
MNPRGGSRQTFTQGPIGTTEPGGSPPVSPTLPWARGLRTVLRSAPLLAGIAILGFFVAVAALSSTWYPGDPAFLPAHLQTTTDCVLPPGPTLRLVPFQWGSHPLGVTGIAGFDVLQGLVMGTRWDLALIALIVLPAAVVGGVVGTVAGGLGGWLDDVLAGLTDVFLAVPEFVLTLVALVFFLPLVAPADRLWAFALILNLALWAPYARGVQARARAVATLPFVEAARAAGATRRRLLFRHVLPNSLFPIFSQIPTTVATILVLLGGLQYAVVEYFSAASKTPCQVLPAALTVLPSPQFPEWTWVMANGAAAWLPSSSGLDPWWGYTFPALWILLFGLGVTLLSDGLIQRWEPRT